MLPCYRKWINQFKKKSSPSLTIAIARTFWFELSKLAILLVTNEILIRITQTILLGSLLDYFRKDSEMSSKDAWLAAGGIVGLSGTYAFLYNQYLFTAFCTGMKVRIAVCSLIYRKALRLSQNALGDTAPGKVVNLLSNDVNRFDLVSILIHYLWSSPILAVVIGYLLYTEVGFAGFIGICIVFSVVPMQCKNFIF